MNCEENDESPATPHSEEADEEQQAFDRRKSDLVKRCETVLNNMERYCGVTTAKRRWYKMIGGLRAVIKLNRICKDIRTYGTSEELLNTKSRSKKAIAQAIDPSLDKYIKPEIGEDMPFGIVHPSGRFMHYWSIVLFVLLCYVGIVMPIRLVFNDDNAGWTAVNYIVDALFFCDVIICCNMAYYDNNETLVTSRKEIILDYLKGWLVMDVMAALPDTVFNHIFTSVKGLPKLYARPRSWATIPCRIIRLLKLYKIVSKGGLFENIQDYLRMNTGVSRLVSFSITVMICNHVAGCVWVYVARLNTESTQTWIIRYPAYAAKSRCGLQNSDNVTLYLTGLYWSYQTLLTIGYGDIPSFTTCTSVSHMR